MEQLRLGSYSRAEIAELLNVNLADTNHFKRNVEAKLVKWGYSYEYTTKTITITRQPITSEERLSEILIREYDLDIQIECYAFAAFLYSIVVFPEFNSMPWGEREKWLQEEFGIYVSERTLRSWCSRLITTSTIVKDSDYRTRWVTGYYNGKKYRDIVDGNKELEELADTYFQDKKQLLEKYKDLEEKEKWYLVRKELWEKYKCCFYYCKGIVVGAFDNTSLDTLQELIELVNDIAEKEPTQTIKIVEQKIENIPIPKNEEFIF